MKISNPTLVARLEEMAKDAAKKLAEERIESIINEAIRNC